MLKQLHHAASVIRNRLFCSSVARQTAHMDPIDRSALVHDIITTQNTDNWQVELDELETALQQAQESLETSQEREQFLGVRLQQYRKAQTARAQALREERILAMHNNKQQQGNNSDNEDEEMANDFDRRMQEWERDEDAVDKIAGAQKDILAQIETMRRLIKDLTVKKRVISKKAKECSEFLQAAADVDQGELAGLTAAYEEAEEEEADMEMSRLAERHESTSNTIVPAGSSDEHDSAADAAESTAEDATLTTALVDTEETKTQEN